MERVWAAGRLRERLKTSLRMALKARNSTAIAALRSAMIPTGHLGVGARDVARRQLSVEDITKILRAEVVGRTAAAAEYERLGRTEQAGRLHGEAATLTSFLDDAHEGP